MVQRLPFTPVTQKAEFMEPPVKAERDQEPGDGRAAILF